MRLYHLDLPVSDVGALRSVLERHFGFTTVDAGRVPRLPGLDRAGNEHAMLVGSDGAYLVLSQVVPAPVYPAPFHFGLLQDSADAVRAKHAELAGAGLRPGEVHDFDAVGAHWTSFFCPLGDGLQVEVHHRTRSELLDR